MSRRRKKRLSKKDAQIVHAQRRALERYQLHVTPNDLRALVNKIQAGKATRLEKQSLRISKWLVEHEGVDYPVIYDNKRKMIVTFLPSAVDDRKEMIR